MIPIPCNRHLIVGTCKDPRTSTSPIIAPDTNHCAFGVVEAVDPAPLPAGAVAQADVGDIVYFRPSSYSVVIVDENVQKMLVHEGSLMMRVRGAAVQKTDVLATEQPAASGNPAIMVTQKMPEQLRPLNN